MYDSGRGIDIVTVGDYLASTTQGFDCGILGELIETVASSPQLDEYVDVLTDRAARRELIRGAFQLQGQVEDTSKSLGDCLLRLEKLTGKIADYCEMSGVSHVAPVRTVEIDPAVVCDTDFAPTVDPGVSTGWNNVDKNFRPARGKLTLVTGVPNDGKSLFANQLCVQIAGREGWKFGVYSPEAYPFERLVRRFCQMVTSKAFDELPMEHRRHTVEWVQNHFVFLSSGEKGIYFSRLLRACREWVNNYGIQGLLIDPWNWIRIDRDYYQAKETQSDTIGNVLTDLIGFTRRHNLSTFVVAHPAKQEKGKDGKYKIVSGYDIAGSANFFNKPDNGITVYRNWQDKTTDIFTWKIKEQPEQGRLGRARLEYRPPGLLIDWQEPKQDSWQERY
jgi:hypothetical protein